VTRKEVRAARNIPVTAASRMFQDRQQADMPNFRRDTRRD